MKNNYNPYTVPENFFVNAQNKAVAGFRRRRRAALLACAGVAAAAVLIAVPQFFHQSGTPVQETDIAANNLAQLYEYDIFLQVNF